MQEKKLKKNFYVKNLGRQVKKDMNGVEKLHEFESLNPAKTILTGAK